MARTFSRYARRSASWLVSAVGLAGPWVGSVSAQSDSTGGGQTVFCFQCVGIQAESDFRGSYSIAVSLGDWLVTSAHASTVCVGGGFGSWSGSPSAEWCGDSGPESFVVTGGDSDAGDPCAGAVSSSLVISVNGDHIPSRSATTSIVSDLCMRVASDWESITYYERLPAYYIPDCSSLGSEFANVFATAASSSARSFALSRTGPAPMTLSRTNRIDYSWTSVTPRSPLICEPDKKCPDDRGEVFAHVSMFRSSITTVSSDGLRQSSLRQGVVAYGNQGLVRLGIASNSEFDPVIGPNGVDLAMSGQLIDTLSLGATDDVVNIEFEEDRDSFNSFDGDLNRDGSVCWTDRILFGAARDATVNDLNYNARADFNLDGVVNNDDLVLLNMQCLTFDFDCNGFINGDDFDAYMVAFELGDFVADTDADGFVTGDDVDLFVDGFTGC